MGIGDRVRAAEELKAEAALNAEGKLSGRQLKTLVGHGLAVGDAMALAATGIGFDDIVEIAQQQAANVAQARQGGGDIGTILAQNATQMERLIEKARTRRPESYNGDFPMPKHGGLNPKGEDVPPLRAEFWEAFWDAQQRKAVRDVKLEADTLHITEIRLFNLIQPGEYRVTNHLEEQGVFRVIVEKDEATGAESRVLFTYPSEWVNKASQGRRKPPYLRILRQILGIEGSIDAFLAAQETVAA